MKQIWPNYSYSPTTNVLTLTGLNIDRDQLLLVTAADRGRIMYNFADSSVTASAFTSGSNTSLTLVATTAGLTTTAALVIYYDDQVASNSVTGTVELGPTSLNALESITVTMGQVTVTGGLTDTQLRASAVTIGGTVTVGGFSSVSIGSGALLAGGLRSGGVEPLGLDVATGYLLVKVDSALPAGTNRIGVVTIGAGTVTLGASTSQIGSVTASISNSLTISSLPAISGTVTANVFGYNYEESADMQIPVKWDNSDRKYIPIGPSVDPIPLPISGTVTANVESNSLLTALDNYAANFAEPLPCRVFNLDGAVWASNPLAISGTVTANSSNGSLTTRFGSVTTANTAFATSAVTNTNRKYLLIQNITTAANVITVGIGFTPTTTQGIQLFAGAGLTFEGSYIPTGAVNLLSSVTASCYTILEA